MSMKFLQSETTINFHTPDGIADLTTVEMKLVVDKTGDQLNVDMVEDLQALPDFLNDWFPQEKMIIECKSCNQFGMRKTPCQHCGAPIGDKEPIRSY